MIFGRYGSAMPDNLPPCRGCAAATGIDPGFPVDTSQKDGRLLRWQAGFPEYGPTNSLRRTGRDRWTVQGWKCRSCGLLTLFTVDPV